MSNNMYSKTILIGNLGRDPEMRFLPSGKEVTSFSMATTEKWTGQDGQKNERTTWQTISVYGKPAVACNQYLKKGSKVMVEGRLKADPKTGNPRIWTDKKGDPRATFEFDALTVKFLSTKQADGPVEQPEIELEDEEELIAF